MVSLSEEDIRTDTQIGKDCEKTQGEGTHLRAKERVPHKKPALPTCWSETSSLQSYEEINMDTVNDRAQRYMKQKLTQWKREIGNWTVIKGDVTTPLSIMDRTARQNILIEELNNTVNQLDLTDTCRTRHPTSALGAFSRIDHAWGHKASLNKF